MKSMKRQKDRTLKDELPRSVGAQYATGEEWRNNFRKNEGMEPKQKQRPVVNGTGDRSKFRCCKEQYCIRTWNVRSMNRGKLEVVKQRVIPPALFFFLRIPLVILGLLWFHINFRIICCSSEKNVVGSLIALNL